MNTRRYTINKYFDPDRWQPTPVVVDGESYEIEDGVLTIYDSNDDTVYASRDWATFSAESIVPMPVFEEDGWFTLPDGTKIKVTLTPTFGVQNVEVVCTEEFDA